MARILTRRDWLERSLRSALVLATPVSFSTLEAFAEGKSPALKPTPPNALGPFFKKGAPQTNTLRQPGDPGFPLRVSGRILDTRGDVVPEAHVEVWQTDQLGRYDLTGYRYRPNLNLGKKAEYQFDSVMPGHYPGRVGQHIHYMVTAPGHKPLVTQLYFATDPLFNGDPEHNYKKEPLLASSDLIRPVRLYERPDDIHAEVLFELCLETA